MIPIVEEFLKSLIESTLAEIQKNPDIIEKVFNISATQYGRKFKEFIMRKDIRVVINYPRDVAQLPCYCIMLAQEEEVPEALGDYLDDSDQILSNTSSYVVEADESGMFVQTPFPIINSVPRVINLNTENEIETITLDYDCPGKILLTDSVDVEVGDTLEVSVNYTQLNMSHSGTMVATNYKVECWSDNGDLSVYMYHLLKFIMVSKRQLLIEYGITKPLFRGTDLEPVPQYFPTFVYRRSLLLSGQIENEYTTVWNDEKYDVDNILTKQTLYRSETPVESVDEEGE